jgi:hypothetical protein
VGGPRIISLAAAQRQRINGMRASAAPRSCRSCAAFGSSKKMQMGAAHLQTGAGQEEQKEQRSRQK